MAIFTECGICRKKYRFDSSMAGQVVRCKECTADMDVVTVSRKTDDSEESSSLAEVAQNLAMPLSAGLLVILVSFGVFHGVGIINEHAQGGPTDSGGAGARIVRKESANSSADANSGADSIASTGSSRNDGQESVALPSVPETGPSPATQPSPQTTRPVQSTRPTVPAASVRLSLAAISSDGVLVAAAQKDRELISWDPRRAQSPLEVGHLSSEATALVFLPSGGHLVAGDKEGKLTVWDAQQGLREQLIDEDAGEVTALAVSPDGQALHVGHRSGKVAQYEIRDNRLRFRQSTEMKSPIVCVAASELNLAIGRAGSGLYLHPLQANAGRGMTRGVPPRQMSLSADGRRLAVLRDGRIAVLRTPDLSPVAHLPGTDFTCLKFSPNGRVLATGNRSGFVGAWNTLTRKRLYEFQLDSSILQVGIFGENRLTGVASSGTANAQTFEASLPAPATNAPTPGLTAAPFVITGVTLSRDRTRITIDGRGFKPPNRMLVFVPGAHVFGYVMPTGSDMQLKRQGIRIPYSTGFLIAVEQAGHLAVAFDRGAMNPDTEQPKSLRVTWIGKGERKSDAGTLEVIIIEPGGTLDVEGEKGARMIVAQKGARINWKNASGRARVITDDLGIRKPSSGFDGQLELQRFAKLDLCPVDGLYKYR